MASDAQRRLGPLHGRTELGAPSLVALSLLARERSRSVLCTLPRFRSHEDGEVSRHLPTGDRTAPSRRIQQCRHGPGFVQSQALSVGGSGPLSAESKSRGRSAASPRCRRGGRDHIAAGRSPATPGAAACVVLHARCCVVVCHGPALVSDYRPCWIDFSLDRVTRLLLRVKCLLLRDKCRPTAVEKSWISRLNPE